MCRFGDGLIQPALSSSSPLQSLSSSTSSRKTATCSKQPHDLNTCLTVTSTHAVHAAKCTPQHYDRHTVTCPVENHEDLRPVQRDEADTGQSIEERVGDLQSEHSTATATICGTNQSDITKARMQHGHDKGCLDRHQRDSHKTSQQDSWAAVHGTQRLTCELLTAAASALHIKDDTNSRFLSVPCESAQMGSWSSAVSGTLSDASVHANFCGDAHPAGTKQPGLPSRGNTSLGQPSGWHAHIVHGARNDNAAVAAGGDAPTHTTPCGLLMQRANTSFEQEIWRPISAHESEFTPFSPLLGPSLGQSDVSVHESSSRQPSAASELPFEVVHALCPATETVSSTGRNTHDGPNSHTSNSNKSSVSLLSAQLRRAQTVAAPQDISVSCPEADAARLLFRARPAQTGAKSRLGGLAMALSRSTSAALPCAHTFSRVRCKLVGYQLSCWAMSLLSPQYASSVVCQACMCSVTNP